MSKKTLKPYPEPLCEALDIQMQQLIAASSDVTNTSVENPFTNLFNAEEIW